MKNALDIKVTYVNEASGYVDRKNGLCVCDPLCYFSENNESSLYAWGATKAVKSLKANIYITFIFIFVVMEQLIKSSFLQSAVNDILLNQLFFLSICTYRMHSQATARIS